MNRIFNSEVDIKTRQIIVIKYEYTLYYWYTVNSFRQREDGHNRLRNLKFRLKNEACLLPD